MIHLLVSPSVLLDGLDAWDPDEEPTRFADGVGHNILELHRRLLLSGRPTSVGSTVPSDASLVVLMPRMFRGMSALELLRLGWRLAPHRVMAVRSDFPLHARTPVRFDVAVAPSQAFVDAHGDASTVHLPPLTQRGLRVRDHGRGDGITRVALKSNPENVPSALREPEFSAALAQFGVTLDLDVPARTDGSDQRWHDFGDVDVALCVREEGDETIRKPATKLRNAWAAGVIPIAAREPGYLEIGTDRVDVVFIDAISQIPAVIGELVTDDALRQQLWSGVAATRAALPSVDELLDAWWATMLASEAPPSWRHSLLARVHLVAQVSRGMAWQLRRRMRSRRRA